MKYKWDSIYPDRKVIENDIEKKQLFVGRYESIIASAYVINQVQLLNT